MSSQIRQDYSTKTEAAVGHLVDLGLRASHTYLSLGFYLDLDNVAPEGVGHFFQELVAKNRGHRSSLKDAKPCGGYVFFLDMLKPSQDECGKTQVTVEATRDLERNLNQALGSLHDMGPPCTDPQLRDSLENHLLDEEVKLIMKMDYTQLTSAGWLAPRLGWANIFSKGSPSSMTRSLWSPEAFEEPLCIPLVSDFCLSLSLKPLAIPLTTLDLSSMHWAKWKQ